MDQRLWIAAFTLGCLCFSTNGRHWNIESLVKEARVEAEQQERQEFRAAANPTDDNSAESIALSFLTSSEFIKEVGNLAREQRLALELLHNATGLVGETLFKLLREEYGCSLLPKNHNYSDPDSDPPQTNKDVCPFPLLQCNDTHPYRSIDGSCNNLNFPHTGQANRALARLLEPDYADEMNAPRGAKDGKPLPSARAVSSSVFEASVRQDRHYTLMHMTFGQLLDHDTDRTAVSQLLINGTLVDYKCGSSGCESSGMDNKECYPIPVAADDPDFPNKECLMFVRSQEYVKDSCEIGPRQQPNAITSWLDASFVYGSSKQLLNRLRDTDPARGKLRSTPHGQLKPLLPQQDNKPCQDVDDKIRCFLTGDSRQNEQVGLIAVHTVFMRLHNFYEEELHRVNPHWGGERLFQESRRLLIAVWQHIVYNEYLHVVLGPRYCREYNLKPQTTGYFEGYDADMMGDVFNVFSAAAFRFGHSQIGDFIQFTDKTYTKTKEMNFSSALFRPRAIYESPVEGTSGVDAVILGTVSQAVDSPDRFFSKQISAHMFTKKPPSGTGMDLTSLNIQRGRDHGIPGYTAWRRWCGLSVPKKFSDIKDIPTNVIKKLQDLYTHVDDIDLFPAAMSENLVHSGMVGETFACLIGHQFEVLREGDRFWYETEDELLKFTPEQLEGIRSITLSRIFCETLDEVETIQKYSMVAPKTTSVAQQNGWYQNYFQFKGDYNERMPCSDHPKLNFDFWKE